MLSNLNLNNQKISRAGSIINLFSYNLLPLAYCLLIIRYALCALRHAIRCYPIA